jgi:hypothetical protein
MNSTTVPKTFTDLEFGDVIVVHPDHPGQEIAYAVEDKPVLIPDFSNGGENRAAVDYTTPDGGSGRLILAAHTTVQVLPPELAERIEALASMRAMLDWLEANPQFPIGRLEIRHFPRHYKLGSKAETIDDELSAEVAEVDRLAAEMGVTADHDTHYKAVKSFGRYAAYEVITCNVPESVVKRVHADAGEGEVRS